MVPSQPQVTATPQKSEVVTPAITSGIDLPDVAIPTAMASAAYVKHWIGNDAYTHNLLSHRYGITAAQLDGFLQSTGITYDSSRIDGQKILDREKSSGLDARDYLLKPYDFDRLKQAMDRVKGALSTSTIIESVTSGPLFKQQYPLTVEDRIYLVSADDILLIEAMQGKLIIQTPDKNYEIDGSLQQWQDKLPSSQFVRVHRSYIVNINAIKTIEPWFNQTLQLHLCNKITVPVSRANVKPLKQMLGIST